MFTLIRNYKTLFMMGVVNNLSEKLTPAVDADNDGDLDMKDINKFSPEAQQAIRRVLGDTNMKTLEEGKRFSIQSLIEKGFIVERNGTISEAASSQQSHRDSIEEGNKRGILSGNKLRSAVNFVNKISADQRNALAKVLPGRQLNTTELAQAVAAFQASKGLVVDGKPGRNTIAAINNMTSSERRQARRQARRSEERSTKTSTERSSEVASGKITYPPQGREATIVLQTLVGTPADGVFGPASRKALQVFLKSKGLYTGAIDGKIGRGSIAAIEAYNNGSTARAESSGYVGGKIERVGRRSKYQELFKYIDSQTGAISNKLRTDITTTLQEDPNNEEKISKLFNEVVNNLSGIVPDNVLKKISRIKGLKKQRDFLNEISSVMMGGKRTNEAAKGRASVGEYARNLKATKSGVDRILANEGLSSDFRSRVLAAVRQAESKISSLTNANKVGYSASRKPTLTVRSQGGNKQLEAKEPGNMQIITIDGRLGQWNLGEISLADKLTLIDNMSYTTAQLGLGNIDKEALKKLVSEGKVEIDFDMILARNCGNISLIPNITKRPAAIFGNGEGGSAGNDQGSHGVDGDPVGLGAGDTNF